ncbi:MAG: hypothetical protein JST68_15000 [Bacteroidetes bacterium]|nr:hypothetical protein [Bacteroidota bacterium]
MRPSGPKKSRLITRLSEIGFRRVFDSINQYGIKKGVDEMGIDAFIEHCARLSAGTGAITGIGGPFTFLIGIPADLLNNLTQQFRVTLGVIYYRRGTYNIGFDEFMSIVAISLGVEASLLITRTVLEKIAERILLRLGARAGGRLIPIAGAIVGSATNYLFIKSIGKSVKRLSL